MAMLLRSIRSFSRPLVSSFSVQFSPGLRESHTAVQDDSKRLLEVKWKDGRQTQHPYTWLKDSCRCSTCAHPTSNNRLTLMRDLDLHCSPKCVDFDEQKDMVRIEWNDAHQSVYPFEWLTNRCFSSQQQQRRRTECFGPPARPWGSDHTVRHLEWKSILEDKTVMLDFVKTVKEDGLCLVRGAPTEESALDSLINAIGFPLTCNYGVYFDVKYKGGPSNISYTPTALNIHTDLTCATLLPGVQFLHCMRKTKGITGGANQITDGLFVSQDIRQNHPEAFKVLTETVIQYWDYGTDFVKDYHYVSEHTTIKLNRFGEVCGIAFSNHMRDTNCNIPAEKVDDFYKALQLFDSKLYEHCVYTELVEGDILVMDNHRVAHGRSQYYIGGPDDQRHLRGTYIAWDEFSSRLRRLMAEIKQ